MHELLMVALCVNALCAVASLLLALDAKRTLRKLRLESEEEEERATSRFVLQPNHEVSAIGDVVKITSKPEANAVEPPVEIDPGQAGAAMADLMGIKNPVVRRRPKGDSA